MFKILLISSWAVLNVENRFNVSINRNRFFSKKLKLKISFNFRVSKSLTTCVHVSLHLIRLDRKWSRFTLPKFKQFYKIGSEGYYFEIVFRSFFFQVAKFSDLIPFVSIFFRRFFTRSFWNCKERRLCLSWLTGGTERRRTPLQDGAHSGTDPQLVPGFMRLSSGMFAERLRSLSAPVGSREIRLV